MDFSKCKKRQTERTNWLPNETISFNPSEDDDVDKLLHKYGPEGVYEIAEKLKKVAIDDFVSAMNEDWNYWA